MRINAEYRTMMRGHGEWYNAHIYRSQRHSSAVLGLCILACGLMLLGGCWIAEAQSHISHVAERQK